MRCRYSASKYHRARTSSLEKLNQKKETILVKEYCMELDSIRMILRQHLPVSLSGVLLPVFLPGFILGRVRSHVMSCWSTRDCS